MLTDNQLKQLKKEESQTANRTWSEEDLNTIKQLKEAGISPKVAFENNIFQGRSKQAVAMKFSLTD